MKCPICGSEKKTLYSHVFKVHHLNKEQFHKQYPNCELSDKSYSERMSKVHKDLCTKEYRQMLSRIHTESYKNPKVHKALSNAQKKRWKRPEEKDKLSNSLKKLWKTEDYRSKMSKARVQGAKEQWKNTEKVTIRKKHISDAQKRLWEDADYRSNQIKAFKKVWENPEYRKQRLEKFTNVRSYIRSDGSEVFMRSTYEVKCSEYLDSLNIRWEYEKCPYLIRGFKKGRKVRYYYPDFYLPSLNLFLEVKSEFYYNLGKEEVELKISEMEKMGNKVLLVMEEELKSLESFSKFLKNYGCADTLINSPQIGKS